MVKIQFLGAAQTVTGSSYLVSTDKVKFLVDCGMFQGLDVESRNYDDFVFDPTDIEFVVITHSHIDHIGLLSKLVNQGFRGPIFMTPNTAKIAHHLLLDAAKIQENNVKYGKSNEPMLYNTTDAQQTISQINIIGFDDDFYHQDVKLRYEVAGHILGAASLRCEIEDKVIYFSGDIGRKEHSFLQTFDTNKRDADYILMEALYGGKYHEQREEMIDDFIESVSSAIGRDGNVIIPSFAVQRTQEILNVLQKAYREGQISKKVITYLDSPLAERVTREYTQNIFEGGRLGKDLFEFEQLRYVRNKRGAIKKMKRPHIVIAGSGMCQGGKVLGHLARNFQDKRNLVAIVGFQAEGTLGRKIVQRPGSIEIQQREFSINAEIKEFYGFSAHGDHSDIMAWFNRFDREKLQKVFLVHAEAERMEDLVEKEDLGNIAYMPDWKEEITL